MTGSFTPRPDRRGGGHSTHGYITATSAHEQQRAEHDRLCGDDIEMIEMSRDAEALAARDRFDEMAPASEWGRTA